jgi:hypothetical protein
MHDDHGLNERRGDNDLILSAKLGCPITPQVHERDEGL